MPGGENSRKSRFFDVECDHDDDDQIGSKTKSASRPHAQTGRRGDTTGNIPLLRCCRSVGCALF